MHATTTVPFTALLADTILEHGVEWARHYLRRTLRLPQWEVNFWLGCPPVARAMDARWAWERATGARV